MKWEKAQQLLKQILKAREQEFPTNKQEGSPAYSDPLLYLPIRTAYQTKTSSQIVAVP